MPHGVFVCDYCVVVNIDCFVDCHDYVHAKGFIGRLGTVNSHYYYVTLTLHSLLYHLRRMALFER